ncbi:hypothetical protein [Nocardiopsis sp. JB363]|uniref:hypothetical protein n=1 Tax=Nocardiopsis sp. JB363 TaxID=1434837 RepID=UPI00097B8B3C|nr:hypothetical protein [Nocardiopsis sp. JB363]SIO86459.1 hypothetical protein BQ8420_12110 [Nocardiopsis sp. JB363]
MIRSQEMMRAQGHSSGGQILREWRQQVPYPVTLRVVEPIVGAVHGPEFDAVWMVLALQALLPHRFADDGQVGIGQAAATGTNFARLRKAIVAARNGDRDAVVRHVADIAKAHHAQAGYAHTLGMRRWAKDTACALSQDRERVWALSQKWTMEYKQATSKKPAVQGPVSAPQLPQERFDEHA